MAQKAMQLLIHRRQIRTIPSPAIKDSKPESTQIVTVVLDEIIQQENSGLQAIKDTVRFQVSGNELIVTCQLEDKPVKNSTAFADGFLKQ